MKKILIFLTTILVVTGCNSKKKYTIAELTTKLSPNSNECINIGSSINPCVSSLPWEDSQNDSHRLTKYNIISAPLIYNNMVFVADDSGSVNAFCMQTKELLWSRKIFNEKQSCGLRGGGILYDNGKLYITNGSRYLVILNPMNGYEILRKEFSDIIRVTPILIEPNKVLIQTVSDELIIFDHEISKTKILHEGYIETVHPSYNMTPIIYNTKIIAAYSSEKIFSIDYKKEENEGWVINLNELIDKDKSSNMNIPGFDSCCIVCAPLIIEDSLYVATTSGQILKINPKTGKVIWKSQITDIQSISHIGNSIFITTNGNQIASLSLLDGKVKWVSDLDNGTKNKDKNIFYSQPIITCSVDGKRFITVFDNKGYSYNFLLNNNQLGCVADIIQVPKNICYVGFSNCLNQSFLITNKKIMFIAK